MASQPVASSSQNSRTDFIEILSFLQELHAYLDLWEPRIGAVLLLQQESDNSEDKLAVTILKSERLVGHVSKNLAPIPSPFLCCSYSKAVVGITGKRVNCRVGYCPRSPGVYHLYGPYTFLQRIKHMVGDVVTKQ